MQGTLVKFRHRDARSEAKRRPGVVEAQSGLNLRLFYGSTFKRSNEPVDSIEIDPAAEPDTRSRNLADYLGFNFVQEPTFFHGSLVSELEALCWSHLDLSGRLARIDNEMRRLLPRTVLASGAATRTVALLEALPRGGIAPFDSELIEYQLERGWEELVALASPERASPFPSWEELLDRISRRP